MKIEKLKAPIGCLFAGMIYALGFPSNISTPLISAPILGFAIYFYFIRNSASLKKIILNTISFSAGFNILGFYWIPHTLSEFGAIPPGLSHLLWLLFSFIILPQHWVGAIVIFYLSKKMPHKFLSTSLLFAFTLTLLENIIPQQFPAHIGHAWLVLKERLFLVPLFGAAIYSFISYLLAFEISSFKHAKPIRISIIVLALLLLHTFMPKLKSQGAENLNIRIVQANINNAMKLAAETNSPFESQSVLDMYRQLSLAPSSETIDLIIWPETAYPFAFSVEDLNQRLEFTPQIFQQILQMTGAEVLIGGYDRKLDAHYNDYFETEWNSAVLFSQKNPLQVYHKHMLIPFGETLPFGPLNQKLSQYLTNVSFFARGTNFNSIKLKNTMSIITPICYEILSPQLIRTFLNNSEQNASLMINLTNDSWYGDTTEPAQHLFLAHWRALEFQMPIIRSTNTGISSVLYQDGSESLRLNVFEREKLDLGLKLQINPDPTFYQRWGLWGSLSIMLLFLLLAAFIERKEIQRQ